VGEAPGGFVVCDIDIDIDINIDSNSAMHSTKHSVSLGGGSTNWVMAQAVASTGSSHGGGGGFGGPGCFCTDMSSCTCGGRGRTVAAPTRGVAVAPPPGLQQALVTRTSDAELAEYWAKVAALAAKGSDGLRHDAEMAPVGADSSVGMGGLNTDVEMPAHRAVAGSSLGNNGDAGAVLWSQPLSQSSGTGLSQGVQQIALSAMVPPPATMAPSGPVAVDFPTSILQSFIDAEVAQHLELVRAASRQGDAAANVVVQYPGNWSQLRLLLQKLAYDPTAEDPWRRLGLAMYEGPKPGEQLILERARVAQLLCDMAARAQWAASCSAEAAQAKQWFKAAAEQCCTDLPSALAERKRHKLPELDMHRELGAQALRVIQVAAAGTVEEVYTQLSTVLDPTNQDVAYNRSVATDAGKGNDTLWHQLAGRRVVLWSPDDANAVTRLAASYLRCSDPNRRPLSVRFIAAIPLHTGMGSVQQVRDLWNHPLYGQKWAPLLQDATITVAPMEMVLPGRGSPRHVKMGLATFLLSHGALVPRSLGCLACTILFYRWLMLSSLLWIFLWLRSRSS